MTLEKMHRRIEIAMFLLEDIKEGYYPPIDPELNKAYELLDEVQIKLADALRQQDDYLSSPY